MTTIETPINRFCRENNVTVHRDFGIGDVTVRGEGVRLRVTPEWIERRVMDDYWTETIFLDFLESGVAVARSVKP